MSGTNTIWVTLDKSLKFSGLPFPQLQNGDSSTQTTHHQPDYGQQYSVSCRAPGSAESRAVPPALGIGWCFSTRTHSPINQLLTVFHVWRHTQKPNRPRQRRRLYGSSHIGINFLSQFGSQLSWNSSFILLKRAVYPLGAIYSLYFQILSILHSRHFSKKHASTHQFHYTHKYIHINFPLQVYDLSFILNISIPIETWENIKERYNNWQARSIEQDAVQIPAAQR